MDGTVRQYIRKQRDLIKRKTSQRQARIDHQVKKQTGMTKKQQAR